MNFVPFELIDNIKLTVRETEIKSLVDLPCDVRKNSIGLIEYDFENYVFRFHESGDLSEVTVNCNALELNQELISFKELSNFIAINDIKSFEKVGFIISPKYGIVFDPEFESWVTFLTKSGLLGWLNV